MPLGLERRSVVYAPGRIKRLLEQIDSNLDTSTSPETPPACVFCPGNESMTPPEVWAYNKYGWPDRPPNTCGGWEVRVFPNKYPIDGTLDHEVVVFTPEHGAKDLSLLSVQQTEKILLGHRERFGAHEKSGKRVLAFINKGEVAGASQEHPHSQIVTHSPEDLRPDASLLPKDDKCVVYEKDGFILHCPKISEYPLEMVLQANEPLGSFGSISDEKLGSLAVVFKQAVTTLENNPCARALTKKTWGKVGKVDDSVPYHAYLKSCIYNGNGASHGKEGWHIRFMPCLTISAGYEAGTHRKVNIITPQLAADLLRRSSTA